MEGWPAEPSRAPSPRVPFLDTGVTEGKREQVPSGRIPVQASPCSETWNKRRHPAQKPRDRAGTRRVRRPSGGNGGEGSRRREPPSCVHAAPRLKPEILGPQVRAPKTAAEVCMLLTVLSIFVPCGLLSLPALLRALCGRLAARGRSLRTRRSRVPTLVGRPPSGGDRKSVV